MNRIPPPPPIIKYDSELLEPNAAKAIADGATIENGLRMSIAISLRHIAEALQAIEAKLPGDNWMTSDVAA